MASFSLLFCKDDFNGSRPLDKQFSAMAAFAGASSNAFLFFICLGGSFSVRPFRGAAGFTSK